MKRYNKITKIISGGQTGADLAGLKFAKSSNIPTGGIAPLGYRTEDGNNFDLRDVYELKEHKNADYKYRTMENVFNSDGTVIFAERSSGGSIITMKLCKQYKKPYIISPSPDNLIDFLNDNKIGILNVAGNRESVSPGIEQRVIKTLSQAIQKVKS